MRTLTAVSHWACRRHGTINRRDALCPVCSFEATGTARPLRERAAVALRSFVEHVIEGLAACGDALGQW